MALSKRLETVCGMVTEGNAVLDVGCDHAFVPLALVRQGKIPCALASDLRKGPLKAAEAHIREAGFEDRISVCLADGVPTDWERRLAMLCKKAGVVPENGGLPPVTLITAGMGGMLMAEIYEQARSVFRNITECVASPQRDADYFRRKLGVLGFSVAEERFLLEEGKYYPVIRAVRGAADPLTEAEARYGPCLLRNRDPVLLSYLKKQEEVLAGILQRLPEEKQERRSEILSEMNVIKEALENYI